MVKQSLLILLLFFPIIILSQETETNKSRIDVLWEKGLTRYSFDYSIFTVLKYSEANGMFDKGKSPTEQNFGSGFRFSSSWYFTPDNINRFYFRVNWIRSGFSINKEGILINDDFRLFTIPMNIGLGDNIRINENINLDLTCSAGPVVIGPAPLSSSFLPGPFSLYAEPIFGLYPEVKFHYKRFGLGLTYSHYTFSNSFYQCIGFMIIQRL